MPQLYVGRFVIVGLLGGLIGLASVFMSGALTGETDLHITPQHGAVVLSEPFTVTIDVSSDVPVNVFSGELTFDPTTLRVARIDYNTSIADLWAERPWYSNGDGTLNFIGGTTRSGGFTGTGSLITITFDTRRSGTATLGLQNVRILAHDGLGSDTSVRTPIDAIFTVAPEMIEAETVLQKPTEDKTVHIQPQAPDTDLNHDGKQSMADVSIFMQHLATGNLRSDFNGDGTVSMADASILLNAD